MLRSQREARVRVTIAICLTIAWSVGVAGLAFAWWAYNNG